VLKQCPLSHAKKGKLRPGAEWKSRPAPFPAPGRSITPAGHARRPTNHARRRPFLQPRAPVDGISSSRTPRCRPPPAARPLRRPPPAAHPHHQPLLQTHKESNLRQEAKHRESGGTCATVEVLHHGSSPHRATGRLDEARVVVRRRLCGGESGVWIRQAMFVKGSRRG
jgi:hypothetical protein